MAASALDALTEALRRLPGVGVKSAQRMTYHLLQHDRAGAERLARALQQAVATVRHCTRCHTFTEAEVCRTCLDAARDHRQLCVVETPADQAAIERSGSYHGLYFVLMGRLSPLDGIGVHDIGLVELLERASDGEVQELIVATNFTAGARRRRTRSPRRSKAAPSASRGWHAACRWAANSSTWISAPSRMR